MFFGNHGNPLWGFWWNVLIFCINEGVLRLHHTFCCHGSSRGDLTNDRINVVIQRGGRCLTIPFRMRQELRLFDGSGIGVCLGSSRRV